MPSELIEFMYISTRVPSLADDEIVDEIALPSMRSNHLRDITGCLWFDQRHFMQVLEGAPDAVDRLMERICADARHTDVLTLRRRTIETRSFDRFSLKVLRNRSTGSIAALLQHAYAPRGRSSRAPDEDLLNECVLELVGRPSYTSTVR